jgi:hypothetical protein
MSGAEPSLREQLLTARAKVEKQIDKLRDRPYPILDTAPFHSNVLSTENRELIEKLTKLLHRLDDALEELGPYD